ncbi:MAG: DUF4157 domain-containing protein [Spirochaetales bacterium]|nr:DUF4157 domain-containing protein [Spirochaetales bacterium]
MSKVGFNRYNKSDSLYNRDTRKFTGNGNTTSDRTFKLDSVLKNQFETAFGVDLSDVRIHVGPFSDEITKQAHADSVTIGQDIYFHSGKYSPDTEEGKALLAHELRHFIHFKHDKRMVYKEDIKEIEEDADASEMIMSQMNLHNISTPVLNDDEKVSFAGDANEDNYARNETKEQIQEPAKGSKDTGSKEQKSLYRIHFTSTGKSYTVTREEREKAMLRTIRKYRDYIDREAALLPEEEREQFVIKHLSFLFNL